MGAALRRAPGPVSMLMLLDFSQLCDLLENVQLVPQPGTFDWHLTADHRYTAASAYGAMFLGSSRVLCPKQL